MERKEDTPVRKTRRKYEEKNKEKRKQASGNFGTMIPRALYDEINAFLEENGITKVRLIKEGYEALKNMKKTANCKPSFLPFYVNKSLIRRLYLRKTRLKDKKTITITD